MSESLHSERDTSVSHLTVLIDQAQPLRDALSTDPRASAAIRAWQAHCAAIVNQLSGGSKAHWLSRAFSEALLVRSSTGAAVEESTVAHIVDRLVSVLERARQSLLELGTAAVASPDTPPRIRRFDFVHHVDLRPVLERAYVDSRAAFDRGEFGRAFMISCGILEAVVTDALDHHGADELRSRGAPTLPIADWSFQTRLEVAERSGLIRSGCARLPAIARTYRDLADADGELRSDVTVSDRDARVTGQVLNVILRDLDPSR